VLPTLEEQAIFKVIADIHRLLGRDTEIIAVARGSDEYFRKLRKLGVKVVYQKVKSVEKSIMVGFDIAKGEILATTDADGTHGSEGLLAGVRMVESGKADMVLGNRMAGLQEGSMGPYLAFGNSALSWIFSVLYRTRVHDVLTGLFVTRKDVYKSIRNVEPYRAGIAFFVIELAKRHYKIREVNIKYYPREYGTSKLSRFKLAYGLGVGIRLIAHML
jgi:glycosyltransferase involved in cell wall biosynthesis